MTETLLIVDPDTASQRVMVNALKAGRYRTLTAGGFGRAIQLLESSRPDLLITVVRLGQFNGVHLVVLGRSKDPRMAALVVDDRRDAVLEREAMNAGATAYLAKPVGAADLLKRVAEALAARERRWWSRTPLASTVVVGLGPGTARLLDISTVVVGLEPGTARLLDISYGGFRLESGEVHLHHVMKLDLPILGLSVNAERVWSRRTPVDTVWSCGAALVAPVDSEGTQRWRRLVDTVRAGVSFSSRPNR